MFNKQLKPLLILLFSAVYYENLAADQLTDEKISDARLPVLEMIKPEKPYKGKAQNFLGAMANHPDLYASWGKLANHIGRESTLTARHRELIILRVSWLTQSDYEWGHHVFVARKAGISDAEIQRVALDSKNERWSAEELSILQAADELIGNSYIEEATWQELKRHFDIKQLMDIVFTVGQYNMVAMAMKSFHIPMESGIPTLPSVKNR